MMPARYISAMTSMMPEPHTPVIPSDAVACSNPGSFDHRSEPMTLKRGSSLSRSMGTRSIAPGAARCPQLICAPLKAGPGRVAVNAHALDRARSGALSAADLRAFEGGSGRARASDQALIVAEHDLRV